MNKSLKDDSYSIIVRTLGTGGEKYQALLNSIDRQSIKPKHVYIFIAEGYELPQERLGYEEFIYTKKGMWHQRVFGMEYDANRTDGAPLQLVCDDDISFEDDFVERILKLMAEYDVEIMTTTPERLNASSKTKKASSIKALKGFINGARFLSSRSEYRISIAKTGGFCVNTSLKENVALTQSGTFNAFMIKNYVIPGLKLEDEYWLDETGYAWPDDQVFFYKAFLKGFRVMNCRKPSIVHLDAGAGSSSPDRVYKTAFARGRNFLIFWHRFLYCRETAATKRLQLIAAISYSIINSCIYYTLKGIIRRNFSSIKGYVKGTKTGISFIKSESYKLLEKV